MFKKINKPNRKTSKGIDTIFSVLSLPLRVITGPGLMLLPPQTKLIVVLVMMILLIIAVILFGVAFAQIGSRPFSPTTTLGTSQTLPDGSKILSVPYFNQFLEPDGNYYPYQGWRMCGAASSVMIAGYYGKLGYNNDPALLKKYMYQDMGQGLPRYCSDYSGAFSVTAKGYCGFSSAPAITDYLGFYSLQTRSLGVTFPEVKRSIDLGHPLIGSIAYPWGHIFVIKGYTPDGKIVVNDSFKNWQDGKIEGDGQPVQYSSNGNSAIYDLGYSVYGRATEFLYMLEVY
jgi:hypothetical protein